MAPWVPSLRSQTTTGSCILMGVFGISIGLALRSLIRHKRPSKKGLHIKSPRETQLPKLSQDEIAALSYPPNVLPGGRDVETPYGCIKVFEWGPEEGEKVLLMHGISTPCLSLANLAEELVNEGYRVIIFDFFGRGYSDAPSDLPYDMRLYTSQILLVLASSNLSWTGDNKFHLIGYSLGGGIAVPFAKYFPHMVQSVVLIAGGGLIRQDHVSWRSRLLYSTGVFPEWMLRSLVRQRIMPARTTDMTESKMASEVVDVKPSTTHRNSDASGGDSYDNAMLLMRRPGHTVSSVMDWQVHQHQGFLTAFMSSIRHAPIYDQREDWLALGQLLSQRRGSSDSQIIGTTKLPGLRGGRVLLVLGSADPVIVKEELIHDATAVLGEDGFEAVFLECGHEIVMTRGKEITALAVGFWGGD
ncbi:Alpha/Beta hydrolase protein [Podospora didyma]|uniref:Alpha/Beta hydrolase protein n=1 Tax=Podospora didyma TaxID=330526 RepID=A0AAE0U6V6_9PEZI|nr:Alpha/Beta hydrolase protein [Podospora didyma]